MTPIRPLAALVALATLTPLAAHASAPPIYNNSWGTYVTAGFSDNGGSGAPGSLAREANGMYSAYAAATLPDGKLHASVVSYSNPDLPVYCTVLTCSWGTSASASFWEYMTVRPDANHQPGEIVQWSISMDGTKKRGLFAWGDGAYATARYYFGTDPYGWTRPHEMALGAQNGVGGTYQMPADGSPLVLYYYARLDVAAYSGSISDYSNTMAFHWVLPEGATFTSGSGQFMTAAVPEPSTGALVLAGGGLVGWVARRRRAAA